MIHTSCVIGGVSPRSINQRRCCEGRDWSKIEDQLFKINISLVNIISNLDALPRILEDLEDDPLKASKKQIEFSTRFTRNHLCELRKKMNDIRHFLEQSENVVNTKNQMIFLCFTSSFSTSLQAFLNIEKNLKYVIYNKIPLQISEFLNCFGDLCVIANAAYWEGNGEKLMQLEDLNLTLINKLNDIETNVRKAEAQKKEKQCTILKIKQEHKKPPPPKLKCNNNKKINFSMYKSAQANTFEKSWKKKTRALAEMKFGNKVEHMLKLDKPSEESLKNEKIDQASVNGDKNKSKDISVKNSEMSVRSKKKMTVPVSENEIETMVQSISISGMSSESDQELESNNIKDTSNCIVEEKTSTDHEEIIETNSSLNPIIKAENFPMGPVLDEAFKTMFNHIMSQVMTNIDPENKSITEDIKVPETKQIKFREDNVKLICIVEDESSNPTEVEN